MGAHVVKQHSLEALNSHQLRLKIFCQKMIFSKINLIIFWVPPPRKLHNYCVDVTVVEYIHNRTIRILQLDTYPDIDQRTAVLRHV